MCCHIKSTSVSRSRQVKLRKAPTLPPLAMLDLSKPGEVAAHEFLLRATDPNDRMWTLLEVRRHGDVLLCVVRWAHPEQKTKPYALAEVRLTEAAVRWRDYATVEAALRALELAGACNRLLGGMPPQNRSE